MPQGGRRVKDYNVLFDPTTAMTGGARSPTQLASDCANSGMTADSIMATFHVDYIRGGPLLYLLAILGGDRAGGDRNAYGRIFDALIARGQSPPRMQTFRHRKRQALEAWAKDKGMDLTAAKRLLYAAKEDPVANAGVFLTGRGYMPASDMPNSAPNLRRTPRSKAPRSQTLPTPATSDSTPESQPVPEPNSPHGQTLPVPKAGQSLDDYTVSGAEDPRRRHDNTSQETSGGALQMPASLGYGFVTGGMNRGQAPTGDHAYHTGLFHRPDPIHRSGLGSHTLPQGGKAPTAAQLQVAARTNASYKGISIPEGPFNSEAERLYWDQFRKHRATDREAVSSCQAVDGSAGATAAGSLVATATTAIVPVAVSKAVLNSEPSETLPTAEPPSPAPPIEASVAAGSADVAAAPAEHDPGLECTGFGQEDEISYLLDQLEEPDFSYFDNDIAGVELGVNFNGF